jgi:quercetin dioxygenase-like cupin family protein
MAISGESITNPLTGEEITFVATSSDTGGKELRMRMAVKPAGFAPTEHIHMSQEERFTIVRGEILLVVQGKEQTLEEGESVAIPPGTPHVWSNQSDQEAEIDIQFRPPGNMEEFFENLFGLAQEGKTNQRGEPNLLQCSLLSPEYGLYMANPPVPVQRALFAAVRPFAKLLGYRASYPRYRNSPN